MKIKFIFSILFIASVAFSASGQSVVITGKKVTYKRPKPFADYKKEFTITYPKVKAATPALSKKIESSISYASVLHLDLQGELMDFQWLEDADYQVGYNKNGVLSIELSMEGSGAYLSVDSKTAVVDLRSGVRVRPANVFTNLNGLAAMVRKAQKDEIAESIKEIKKDPEYEEPNPERLFKDANFKTVNLDEFSVNGDGVTFHYNYGFPHAIQALGPSGNFTFTWSQLKPYIKRGGLLTRIAR
ncbi:hypothetical protein BH10ACI2_BH10ACI2_09880 [soil metagenome]